MALKSLLGMVKGLMGELSKVDGDTYASSTAYYSFLSLVPSLALCISLISLLGVEVQEVIQLLTQFVPSALKDLMTTIVSDAFERSGIAFSLSSVTLIWSASQGVKALRRGLNVMYGVQETRNGLVVAAISVVSIIILGVLAAAAMYLVFSPVVVGAISTVIPITQHESIWAIVNPIVVLGFGVLVFAACYAYLPAGKRRYKSQLPGAALAMVSCAVISIGFRVYVEYFSNFTVLYGSIATIALLLFWLYLISFTLLAGGIVNRLLSDAKQSES